MTAATTPNTASRGDWAWPLKPPAPPPPAPSSTHLMPSPSPPLELQFLPPSAAASAATATPPSTRLPPASPWTVDPSRLQKLMMGSVAAVPPATSIPIGSRAPVPDFGAFFDPGINKPLPSGWERCLDLKSGEVFIKKCEVVSKATGISPGRQRWQGSQAHELKHPGARPMKFSDKIVQVDEQRPEWMPNWVLGTPVLPRSGSISKGMGRIMKMNAKVYGEEERPSSPDRHPLCLDLGLRLTSDNRSRLASEAPDFLSSRGPRPASSALNSRDFSSHSRVQTWKWQPAAHENERPASIQEMVSESTMATAVCSKCLMYVLLKKSNPTCPRCFNPIILDCGAQTSAVKKRPRLELSPDDLSLSTDSSR